MRKFSGFVIIWVLVMPKPSGLNWPSKLSWEVVFKQISAWITSKKGLKFMEVIAQVHTGFLLRKWGIFWYNMILLSAMVIILNNGSDNRNNSDFFFYWRLQFGRAILGQGRKPVWSNCELKHRGRPRIFKQEKSQLSLGKIWKKFEKKKKQHSVSRLGNEIIDTTGVLSRKCVTPERIWDVKKGKEAKGGNPVKCCQFLKVKRSLG